MDIYLKKQQLRKEAKAYRKSLSEENRRDKSDKIKKFLKEMPAYQDATVILMYASLADEVETLSFIEDLLRKGSQEVYCPVTTGTEMDFYQILSLDELKEGNFHVLEPEISENRHLKLSDDIHYCMIIPGLMFDKQGNRLGYGKGYYDKYLAKVPENINLTTIALSYEAMVKDKIPAEETDRRVNYVVTENGTIDVKYYI